MRRAVPGAPHSHALPCACVLRARSALLEALSYARLRAAAEREALVEKLDAIMEKIRAGADADSPLHAAAAALEALLGAPPPAPHPSSRSCAAAPPLRRRAATPRATRRPPRCVHLPLPAGYNKRYDEEELESDEDEDEDHNAFYADETTDEDEDEEDGDDEDFDWLGRGGGGRSMAKVAALAAAELATSGCSEPASRRVAALRTLGEGQGVPAASRRL